MWPWLLLGANTLLYAYFVLYVVVMVGQGQHSPVSLTFPLPSPF